MIFSFFDPVLYKNKPTTDIYRNYKQYFDNAARGMILRDYTIKGNPRPEELAYLLYGNSNLYWILLMANNIYDPYHGWIKSQNACYTSAEQIHDGENKVLYHIDRDYNKYYNLTEYPVNSNLWYDLGDKKHKYLQFEGPLRAIDIYEDSILENEKKRHIKILDKRDLSNFLTKFIREMETA